MNRVSGFLILVLFVSLFSCTNQEIGSIKDVNPQSIYFDYRIWGGEEDENITVKLQYRFAGPNGTTLVLEEPSKVELDGVILKVDSSKFSGAFYEVSKPVNEFKGKHTIEFTDINQKKYREEFSFQPLTLKTVVPATIRRDDLVFELDGLDPEDYVRVLLTDTSFETDGINRVDTVRYGRLQISKVDLRSVHNGPVKLELFREYERPVKNGTEEGGRLSISYGIKREFKLKSSALDP